MVAKGNPSPGGLSRIGISYAFLRFWNLALTEKLCIPLNILGYYISITMKSYLESGIFVKKLWDSESRTEI